MRTWLQGDRSLRVWLHADGVIRCGLDGQAWSWTLPALSSPPEPQDHVLVLHRPPEALLLGAGPETPVLVPLLRQLGWQLTVVERRPRWRAAVAPDTRVLDLHPDDAVAARAQADVALVMHHGFEADREALEALAASRIPFIGLLGPRRRRDDLFKLLRPADRDALAERLHAPIGVPGCGRGPEAIALSIATQLQQWRGAQAALLDRSA
ncbi:XshC-Cox1-family protein [Lysobacteraceae bacterium NML93-0399]|nr:XshC-Cox1-family protein [Xanthomonadaceae bacterium NML93-0399]